MSTPAVNVSQFALHAFQPRRSSRLIQINLSCGAQRFSKVFLIRSVAWTTSASFLTIKISRHLMSRTLQDCDTFQINSFSQIILTSRASLSTKIEETKWYSYYLNISHGENGIQEGKVELNFSWKLCPSLYLDISEHATSCVRVQEAIAQASIFAHITAKFAEKTRASNAKSNVLRNSSCN